jgi:hypothetical protein
MPRKAMPTFNAALEPLAADPPQEIAAAIGSIIARHSYLDWVLGQVMYDLMEISIKQGRMIMKLPRPKIFVGAVQELFDFHGLKSDFDFDDLAEKLEVAGHTCREMSRSVYMRESGSREIQLVRSLWDAGPGADTQPESQRVDTKFLAQRRKEVDDAVKAAEKLRAATDKLLRESHEKRARPGFDRRKRGLATV